jgi:hypothetical protein
MYKQTYNKSRQGGEARGFDPGTSAPITTSTTNAPPPWDVAGNGAENLKKCTDLGDFGGRVAHSSRPPKTIIFYYLNGAWARIPRRENEF